MSKYTNPSALFSGELSRVAPTFAENRFQWVPPSSPGEESTTNYVGPTDWNDFRVPSYKPNMAAIEIYNANNPLVNSLMQGGQSAKLYGGNSKNYGHSEPRIMRELLDRLIPSNFKEAGVQRPSETSRSAKSNEREYEILSQLVQNPTPYKGYLEGTNKRINAISELPFCTTEGGCAKFMGNISPSGSNLAHVVASNWNDRRPAEEKVQEVMENQVRPAYKDYKDNQYFENLLNSPAQRNFTQSLSRPVSPEESIVPLYKVPPSPFRASTSSSTHSPNYFPRTPMSSSDSWDYRLQEEPNYSTTREGVVVTPYQSSSSSYSSPNPIYSRPYRDAYSPPSRSDLDTVRTKLF